MRAPPWLRRLSPWRRRGLATIPLGAPAELPWNASVDECRRILRSVGALSLEIDGQPTARLRWGEHTLRARLEFAEGVAVGEETWLPAHVTAHYYTREGLRVRMLPRLRGGLVPLPAANHRANWALALGLLGKPTGKGQDGSWQWAFPHMNVSYLAARPDETDGTDSLRFGAKGGSRVLEVRNQSPLELYDRVRVRVDFQAGSWRMGDRPKSIGVPVRLHWDTPRGEPLLVTAIAGGREEAIEVGGRCTRVILASDGADGVRILA